MGKPALMTAYQDDGLRRSRLFSERWSQMAISEPITEMPFLRESQTIKEFDSCDSS